MMNGQRTTNLSTKHWMQYYAVMVWYTMLRLCKQREYYKQIEEGKKILHFGFLQQSDKNLAKWRIEIKRFIHAYC